MIRVAVMLAAIAAVVAAFAAGGASSAPQVVELRSCAQVAPGLQIQLAGDKDGVSYGRFRSVPIPKGTATVVVWSLGGPASTNGTAVHAWIADARSSLSARCSTVRAALKPPSLRGLAPALRVRDGWFTGRKFACLRKGRLLVEILDVAPGKRVVVRTQRGGEVLAVGQTARGSAWLRGSKRCAASER